MTARTISLSDEDWDRIVKALRDHADTRLVLGFERQADSITELATFLADSLAYARGEQAHA